MKQIVILTGIDLCQARVNKFHTKEFSTLISRKFRNFAHGVARAIIAAARKVKAWATFSNIMLVIAGLSLLVEIPASAIASETDSIESRTALAISAIVGFSALGLMMWKEGYFKPFDETEDDF